ncbi:MAG: hypothetical protein AB8G11_08245 [Saprospiraceae bacterium]
MKRYFSTFLTLFLVYSLAAQKDFRKGYITTLTDETIFVDIYIPYSGKLQTKINDGKTIKYKRRSLADYGYLIDGKKKSQFAATAFPVITYKGYYVTFNDDTIKGYFTHWNSSQITLYKKGNQKKTKLSPSDNVKVFCIKRGTTEERYDQIDYTVKLGLLDSKVNSRQFCRPEIEGTMVLYKTHCSLSWAYGSKWHDDRRK